jgi:hypothetical protein
MGLVFQTRGACSLALLTSDNLLKAVFSCARMSMRSVGAKKPFDRTKSGFFARRFVQLHSDSLDAAFSRGSEGRNSWRSRISNLVLLVDVVQFAICACAPRHSSGSRVRRMSRLWAASPSWPTWSTWPCFTPLMRSRGWPRGRRRRQQKH